MILGQTPGATGPDAQHPIDFTPPTVGGGNIFKLPKTGFYSTNISPMWPTRMPMRAFPAYHPSRANIGPQQMPSLAPPPAAATSMAPAPGPSPAGTAGAFGGSGFGSSGGVRSHSHVDPYMVMRQGVIPGVSPSGSNIRAGVTNAGARVNASMPYQSHALAPDAPPPPPPAAMPAAMHGAGFGHFSWNPFNWFRSRGHAQMVATQAHMQGFGASCQMVGPRLDGTRVLICGGRTMMTIDSDGNVLYNAYANTNAY
jgi:hypothetical protein